MSVLASRETVRVDLDPSDDGKEQWVMLRRELNGALRRQFNARMYVANLDQTAIREGRLTAEAITMALDLSAADPSVELEFWIQSWCVYNEDGTELRLTPESIGLLSSATIDTLARKVGELKLLVDTEKKDSSATLALST